MLFKQFDPFSPASPLVLLQGDDEKMKWSLSWRCADLCVWEPLWRKSKEKTSVFLIHVMEKSRHTELLQVDSVTRIKVEVAGRW